MSEVPIGKSPNDAAPPTDDQAAAAPRPTTPAEGMSKQPKSKPKSRWWWRWSKRLAIAAIAVRLVLWLFLEQIANFGAGFAGLSVAWRTASLSISGLSLTIEDLVVRNANDQQAAALFTAQEVVADLSMRQLLGGQLAIVDAGIDGGRITVQRGPDGELRLPKAWLEPAAVTLPEPEAEPADEDAPLSFALPFWIASTRLHDLQFDFVDESSNPPVQHTGKLDLDVADVGFPDRSGSVMLRLHAPQLCDELFVHAQLQAATSLATSNFQAVVRGFRPQQFTLPQEFLDAINNARVVDVRLGGELTAEVLPTAPKHPALAGSLDFGMSLDGIERSTISSTFGPTVVTGAGTVDVGVVTPFQLAVHSDGIVDALRLQSGRLELSGTRTAVTADLRGERITLTRLQPMLAASGLSLPQGGIDIDASLDAEIGEATSIDLGRVAIRSGQQELLALNKIAVRDLRTVADTLAIGSVEMIGPILPVQRDADGSMRIAGLRLQPTPEAASQTAVEATQPTVPAASGAATAQPTAMTLPKIRLGSFDWSGTQLAYTDNSFEPAATVSIRDLHLHGDAITIGTDAPPGKLTISFAVPEVAERCTAELTLTSSATGLHTELQWLTSGITLRGLQPWLQPMGIASELAMGELRFAAAAKVDFSATGMLASTQLINLQFTDGDKKLLALRSLHGDNIQIANDTSNIGTWSVRDPLVQVHRDNEQLLHTLGLRLGMPAAPNADRSNTNAAAATDLIQAGTAGPVAQSKPRMQAPAALAKVVNPAFAHGELSIDRATLAWSDARFEGRTFSIGLDAKVGASSDDQPLPVSLTLRLDRAMQTCGLEAQLQMGADRDSFVGTFQAAGIQGSELAMLLPEGMSCTLMDGSLHAAFDVGMDKGASSALQASLRGLKLADSGTELAAIDEIVFDAPNLGSDEIHIADAHVQGVRAVIELQPNAMQVPGFAFAQSNATANSRANVASANPPAPAPPRSPPLTLPKLRIDALLCELERLQVRDLRGAASEPLTLRASLSLTEPWVGDPSADEPTPMQLMLRGQCQPLGAQFTADTKLALFDLTPTLDVEFALDNFDTTQLQRVAPSLGAQIRGEATALTAKAKLHAFLNLKRRDASKFDFARTFGAEVVLDNFELRDKGSDEAYLSVASIDAIVRAIDPNTGSVLLRSLTIDDPTLRVRKDAEGTHIAGFLLPAPAAAKPERTPASPGERDAKVVQPTAGTTTDKPSATADQPDSEFEFAIDRFDLLGLNVDFQDTTTTPKTHLSIADTDAQLRRFSTRAFREARPMSFTVAVRGGPIELERRVIKSSVLAGLLTSGAQALVGANTTHKLEQRPLLDEFTADGQLQLFPTTQGRIQLSMTDLELSAFRGLAKQAGVDLSDGLYDMRVNVDLRGHDGINIRSQHVFTYLALDEPPGGPIYRYLRLPAPIQSVLFLLRNEDEQQRIPISLHVPADGVSQSTIINLAVENLIKLISEAVGSAPGRILSSGTDLFGGSDKVPDITVEIPFAPGSPLPSGHDLQPLIDAALADETLSIVLTHEMGSGDQAHVRQLANPDPAVVSQTIARLQQKRAELERVRTPLAAELVALYAAGKNQEALRQQRDLEAVDTHLAELLEALGDAASQLGNPNEREALRRTRRTAIALAERRLDALTAELQRGAPGLLELAKKNGKTPDRSPRLERRPGRGLPVAGLDAGGRIVAVLRRRTAAELPSERTTRTEQLTSSSFSSGFTTVPPVVDPINRPFNNR